LDINSIDLIIHNQMRRSILLTIILVCFSTFILSAHNHNETMPWENCFGVIAGKLATTDGSVILGHNEDDGGDQMLNIYKNENLLWAEFPGMEVADAFVNKYGVGVVSDSCPSKEDRDDFTDGGVLYNIRLHVGQNATSARDAVRIIGEEVEKYGYRSSGRSYLVADANEGWVVAIVKGRHWVAQRVPDDKVMVIPNYYIITNVDLSDTENFAGSPDIIDYAIERGWYNPETDGEFSFRMAYSSQSSLTRGSNPRRHNTALDKLHGYDYPYDEKSAPFAVDPGRKIGIKDVMDILDSHQPADSTGEHKPDICTSTTVVSTIFQLRDNMPNGVGTLAWICPTHPCVQVYVPWYFGMNSSPTEWHRFESVEEALQKHLSDGKDLRSNYPDGLYWKYVDNWINLNESGYDASIKTIQEGRDKLQKKIFARQARLEKRLCRMSPKRASRVMERYTRKCIKWSLKY